MTEKTDTSKMSLNVKIEEQTKGISDVKEFTGLGVRHVLAWMGFSGIACVYLMRINLSVAIIAMVNSTDTTKNSDNESDACPLPDNYDSEQSSSGDFDWDEQTQGLILGSFFYGYACTNLIGGRAAEQYGSRLVVGMGILLTAILTILSPLAANTSSGLFVAVRVLEGCTEGVTFPGMTKIIADYYPIKERSKFTAIVYMGAQLGTVLALIISGFLSESTFLGGWPSVFYIFGAVSIVWSVLWFILIRDDPADNPWISKEELKYIQDGIPGSGQKKEKVAVPWKSIITSVDYYAIVAMHFGYNWGFYTLLTELPSYLDKIQHFSLKSNGVLSSLPYLGTLIFGLTFGKITDKLLADGRISLLNVRRIAMCIAGYGPALMLFLMCFVNCHSTLAIVILVASGTMSGSHPCAFLCSYADMSPRFAGTLMGLGNTFATIPGFVSPAITGAITQDNQTLWAWREVFLIATVVIGITTTNYIWRVTTDVKIWNDSIQKPGNQGNPPRRDNDGFVKDE